MTGPAVGAELKKDYKEGYTNLDGKMTIGGRFTWNMDQKYVYGAKGKGNATDCSGGVCQALKPHFPKFPEGTAQQISYARKNGWEEVTNSVKESDYKSLKPGDIVYLKSEGSPSGRHVLQFAGFDKDGMAVWAEAKGKAYGVGVHGGGIPTRRVIAAFRPPPPRIAADFIP